MLGRTTATVAIAALFLTGCGQNLTVDEDVKLVLKPEQATQEMNTWREQQGPQPANVPVHADVGPANPTLDTWIKAITSGPGVNLPFNITPSGTSAEDLIFSPELRTGSGQT
jgi:hypothetical protein